MAKDIQLTVSSQGIRGNKMKHEIKGYSYLTLRTNGNEVVCIEADTFTGMGSHYEIRPDHLIKIGCPGYEQWTGTPDELIKALNLKKY